MSGAAACTAGAGLVASGFTGAVNIGTEDTVTLMELAATICRLAGRRPHLVSDMSRPFTTNTCETTTMTIDMMPTATMVSMSEMPR